MEIVTNSCMNVHGKYPYPAMGTFMLILLLSRNENGISCDTAPGLRIGLQCTGLGLPFAFLISSSSSSILV